MKGKSGTQLGSDNVERLKTYLSELNGEGRGLPARGGKVNVTAIALACGFDRQVLYKNPAAKQALEEAAARLGLEASEAERATSNETDHRDRRILQLEQANAVLKAEVEALRERLKRFSHIEEHMVETGRRVPR
jgi:hypothetical protein